MKIVGKSSVTFCAEEGHTLRVSYSNRGEPYREGIDIDLNLPNDQYGGSLFLEDHEAKQLRDLLNRLYPERQS